MKTRLLTWLTSIACMLVLAANAYADPGNFEWGADGNGSYVRLYDKDHNPVRVYVSKKEADIKIRPEVQNTYKVDAIAQNIDTKEQNDAALSPFGPKEQFLFYYNRLPAQEKSIYEKIYYAAKKFKKDVDLGPNIDSDRLQVVVQSVIRDHPEMFWFDWYRGEYTSDNYKLIFRYYDFVDKVPSIQKIIDNETQKIVRGANQFDNIYEKVRYVYEYIALNAPYTSSDKVISSIYQFFISKSTSCAANTCVFHYIMNQLGIPARYVIGKNDKHSWNQVILEGKCYNFDVTGGYNSSFTSSNGDSTQLIMDYDYFGLSDSEIRKIHNNFEQDYDLNAVKFPSCNGHLDYKTVFKNAMVSNFYKETLGMSDKYNVAYTLQDYFTIMHHSLSSSRARSITTYVIIVGTALKNKIYDLTYDEIERGYLGDILENYQKDYEWHGSRSNFEIASGIYLLQKKDVFE